MRRPPFADTHVHFFDPREPQLRYDWLRPGGDPEEEELLGDYAAMRSERYWADDFLAETRFQGVERIVHVQAALGIEDPLEETRWLEAFRMRLGVPHAIVASADLAAPDAADVVAQHLATSPAVRGIRDLRYDGYLTDPAWEAGLALLAKHELVCCADPPLAQAKQAAALAARHPEVPFCADHALTPRRRDRDYFAQWREGLRALAAAPNALIKISGLGMGDHAWTVASWRPWVLACIEAFGVERAFFGTNWPVDRVYSSYGDVLDAYAEIVADFSAAERDALFRGNARRVFRLG